jgi:hypothetical protein
MIKSRKLQLGIVLLLACICLPLLGAEPNEATTELEFEIRSERPSISRARPLRSPFGSTHFAKLYIRGRWNSQPIKDEDPVLAILSTNAARTMSPTQRELVSTLPFKHIDLGKTIGNHTYFRVYGVGEYDTQKMVKAFIEALENKANKEVQYYLNKIKESKEKIAEVKKELPEKQKQLKTAESKYKEIKNARYFSLTDSQIYTKAKELMFEMDKMLDTLEIELAGIREKLKEIERYRRSKSLSGKDLSDETVDKLDQMFVEQLVELRGVEARKKAALKIRNREKEFLNLFSQWNNLNVEVKRLNQDLEKSEKSILLAKKNLTNPTPEMRPPKVYQNKVTIYPVK